MGQETEIKRLVTEFVDDLFGDYDRLVCSRAGEDEGRTGWPKQPIIDNLERLIEACTFPSPNTKELWSLGFEDRGMGRFSYAVLRGLPEDQDIVVECGADKKLAEQIISDHNARTFPSDAKLLTDATNALNNVALRVLGNWGGCWCKEHPVRGASVVHEPDCIAAHKVMATYDALETTK